MGAIQEALQGEPEMMRQCKEMIYTMGGSPKKNKSH
jgi:hypothetical protein